MIGSRTLVILVMYKVLHVGYELHVIYMYKYWSKKTSQLFFVLGWSHYALKFSKSILKMKGPILAP